VNVRFHVVGDGSEVSNLKKLVWDLRIDDSVFFHGFKTGKELDEFFDVCHIAVGSLGRDRTNMFETSDLKAREYCARGIPFVGSTTDRDFSMGFPYYDILGSNDHPIPIQRIIDFSRKVLADSHHHERMREYAENRLEWSVKMKKLLLFIQELLSERK